MTLLCIRCLAADPTNTTVTPARAAITVAPQGGALCLPHLEEHAGEVERERREHVAWLRDQRRRSRRP